MNRVHKAAVGALGWLLFALAQAADPEILSPAPGEITDAPALGNGAIMTLRWTSPPEADVIDWAIYVGSTPGAWDIQRITHMNRYFLDDRPPEESVKLGIPADGSTFYLRLFWRADGQDFSYVDAEYVAPGFNTLPPEFAINAGHSGAWFYPITSGQGQFIDVEPQEKFMFLSWFTYTDAASENPNEQQWYTAQGNYSGNTANLDLFQTLGGKFDDPQAVSTTQVGSASVSFNDCSQGQMAYNFDDGRQGQFPMRRVIPGSGNTCEERSNINIEVLDLNAGMDGAWFEQTTSGQGFFIDSYSDPEGGDFIFISWFTYGDETASGQRWLTAQGNYEGPSTEIDVFETTGGSFDDPQAPDTVKVGTMNVDFADCSNAELSYSLTNDDLEGDIAITRVVPGGQALCEELAGAD